MSRAIGVVTVGRSDYDIYVPVLRAVDDDPELTLRLLVTGAHLSPEYGRSVERIEGDGFPIHERIEMLLSSDTPQGIGKSTALGVAGFSQSFAASAPDILLVLGDRFEMLSAAVAALPFNIPIAHIHGGEATEGAIDESIRHAITKMSHLHFVATDAYAERVVQMGEEPSRVTVSGAPALDSLDGEPDVPTPELESFLGIGLPEPPVLVTLHPVTLDVDRTEEHVSALLEALDRTEAPLIVTYPNADTGSRTILRALEAFSGERDHVALVSGLGRRRYFAVMRRARAMVGNSSSGIIEAASFELPVVNIGDRQRGRIRPPNVIDVGTGPEEILDGLRRATDPDFKARLAGMENPYGDGRAAERIVRVLKSTPLGRELLTKRFHCLDR